MNGVSEWGAAGSERARRPPAVDEGGVGEGRGARGVAGWRCGSAEGTRGGLDLAFVQ